MSNQKQARIAAPPPSISRALGAPGNRISDDEEEKITCRFREAIESLRPRPAETESWARFLYTELCGTRIEQRRREKAGSESRSLQKRRLQNIESAAKRLSNYLNGAQGLVFDSWTSAADVDLVTARQEWFLLKRLVEVAAKRAAGGTDRLDDLKDRGRPNDATAKAMSEAAAAIYTELTGKPIDLSINRDSFDAFLTKIFNICDVPASSEYWVRQLLGLK